MSNPVELAAEPEVHGGARRPRIAFVSNSAFGERASRLRWAVLLARRGYDPRFVLPAQAEEDAVEKIEACGIAVDRYHLDRGAPGPSSGLRSITTLARTLSAGRFDIVHTFAHEPNFYGAIAARLARRPILVTQITGLGRLFADDRVRSHKTAPQHCLLNAYRAITRLSTAIVYHNRDDAVMLGFLNKGNATCLASGSGVDVDEYSPARVSGADRAALRDRLGLPAAAVVVTCVGRLVRHKGIRQLLAAARAVVARHPDVRFLVVGGSDVGNKYNLPVNDLERESHPSIKLLGERHDVRELLAISDIFVNPSLREGLPRANLEAMAMGAPLVALHVAGSRETVEHGVNGLLAPLGDVAALADAIATLVGDRALREQMGAAGRRRAVDRFRVELSVDRIEALYRRCLAARRLRDRGAGPRSGRVG